MDQSLVSVSVFYPVLGELDSYVFERLSTAIQFAKFAKHCRTKVTVLSQTMTLETETDGTFRAVWIDQ